MALISCGECGRSMSDTAAACPQCGWVVPVRNGVLVVARKTQLNSGIVATRISVDGGLYGSLRSGQQLDVELEPGVHSVYVEKNNGGSVNFNVRVSPGASTRAEVAISVMGGLKITTDD